MKETYIEDTVNLIGQEVTLYGWAEKVRDLGKIVFIDLRDSTGTVQIVHDESVDFGAETLLRVSGLVKERSGKNVNADKPTGNIEIEAKEIEVVSPADTPPFPLTDEGYDLDEALRLKFRYLDLRRPRLLRNLKIRDRYVTSVREFLHERGFTEVETPLLTKSTPEGARDFLVPSRQEKGKFYALPQSPQQYKQLLMAAGLERYFQIARCLRDEDLRADRSFEHTQIDLEMSFVERAHVMALTEAMMIEVVESLGGVIKEKPFPVFSYQEAQERFGSDKFDLRSEAEKDQNVHAFAWVVNFPFFEKTDSGSWTFTHNPFSNPVPEDKEKLLAGEIESITADQYDLVCNGYEVGGGSIRAHETEVLKKVFEVLGHTPETIEREFGHMLTAFSYGMPPHGGIALGLDRLLAIFLGEKSVFKEVVAFPMSYSGKTSVMEAPSSVSGDQLKELGLTGKIDELVS